MGNNAPLPSRGMLGLTATSVSLGLLVANETCYKNPKSHVDLKTLNQTPYRQG